MVFNALFPYNDPGHIPDNATTLANVEWAAIKVNVARPNPISALVLAGSGGKAENCT